MQVPCCYNNTMPLCSLVNVHDETSLVVRACLKVTATRESPIMIKSELLQQPSVLLCDVIMHLLTSDQLNLFAKLKH